MAGTVQATNGVALPLADLIQTLTYDGAFVATIVVSYRGIVYTQTFTNNGTQITGVGQFIPTGVVGG